MSDRCCLKLNYAACDRAVVEDELGAARAENVVDGVVSAAFHGINYGGDAELGRIADAGVPFHGRHDAGDEYGACFVAGVDGSSQSWPAGLGDALAVDCDIATGRLTDITGVEEFRRLILEARAAVAERAKKGNA